MTELDQVLDRLWPDTRAIWDETKSYLKDMEVYRVDEVVPYYLIAMGCHILNIRNRTVRPPIYTRQGMIPDLRFHLFAIGPPGYGKTYFPERFFNRETGIATEFPNYEMEDVTYPALMGTVNGKNPDGSWDIAPGIAERYRNHILWTEEMESVESRADKKTKTVLLKLADDGRAGRDLGRGVHIDVLSFATFILGWQNELVDPRVGMTRRFGFVDLTPTSRDVEALKDAWDRGEGLKPDEGRIADLRFQYDKLWVSLEQLKEPIVIDDAFRKFRQSLDNPHIDLEIVNRIAIGYNFMTNYDWGSQLVVKDSPELRALIVRALEAKYNVLGRKDYHQIMMLLKDGPMALTKLKKRLQQLGVAKSSYKVVTQRIDELTKLGIVEKKKVDEPHAKRKVTYVSLVEDLSE